MDIIILLNIISVYCPKMRLDEAFQFAADLQRPINSAIDQAVAAGKAEGWSHEALVKFCRMRQDLQVEWNNGKRIQVIKEVRTQTHVGLRDAKVACEEAYGSPLFPPPSV